MKKIYLLIVILAFSAKGFGQQNDTQSILDKLRWNDEMLNIMLDTRVDLKSSINNGSMDELSFQGQTLKLWLVGEIVPGIRYRVRHRLNKPQSPLREGYSAATDQAWLAFDIGNKWTITAGKQSVQFGTFEYDYNPADIYLGTIPFDDLDAYKTGINAAYKFAGQTLNVQVINSDAPQFASEDYKKKAMAINVLWEGSLLEGKLKTRWAYGAFQHKKDKFYNWITVGTQVNLGNLTTELDYYLGNRNMDYGYVVGNDELGARYVEDQAVSLNFKYNFGKFRPFVKGIWNQRHDKELKQNAYLSKGLQAVMEYYPFTDKRVKDLRFHAMYAYNTTNFQGVFNNLKNNDTHMLLVGTRWLFKVK